VAAKRGGSRRSRPIAIIGNVNEPRTGRIVRALRRRLGWRQADLAAKARCSQSTVSVVERGHVDRVSLRTLRRILAALDAAVFVEVRWRGGALDRLLDAEHSAAVAAVIGLLQRHGWLVELEVTYSEWGERGSYDVLALHPASAALLVVEVKTDLASIEATLRKLDEKRRLAPRVARERYGWRHRTVSPLLVMPEDRTLRRRVALHDRLFRQAFSSRNVAVKRWLARPVGGIAGLLFVPRIERSSAVRRPGGRTRVDRGRSLSPSDGAAA
jgi:transcriptional regulator with XRE-family HTH domain